MIRFSSASHTIFLFVTDVPSPIFDVLFAALPYILLLDFQFTSSATGSPRAFRRLSHINCFRGKPRKFQHRHNTFLYVNNDADLPGVSLDSYFCRHFT